MSVAEKSSSPPMPMRTLPEAAPLAYGEGIFLQRPEIDKVLREAIAVEVKLEVAREIASWKAIMATSGVGGCLSTVASGSRRLTIKEMVPLMPPGLRSESSIRRALEDGSIPGRKHRGRWSLDRVEVENALFKTASVRERTEKFAAHWEANRKAISESRKWPRKIRGFQLKTGS